MGLDPGTIALFSMPTAVIKAAGIVYRDDCSRNWFIINCNVAFFSLADRIQGQGGGSKN